MIGSCDSGRTIVELNKYLSEIVPNICDERLGAF